MVEELKIIDGFNGKYKISNLGYILTYQDNPCGRKLAINYYDRYPTVQLWNNCKFKNYKIFK